MEKELILLVGVQFVGKYEYMKNNFFDKPYQIISYSFIEGTMNEQKMNPQMFYPIVSLTASNLMKQELSIVVNGLNISLEALHIWKKMCFQYGYKYKLIVFDNDKKKIEQEMKKMKIDTEENKKVMKENMEMIEELKTVLSLKHQKIADEIIYVSSEDKKDEILQN